MPFKENSKLKKEKPSPKKGTHWPFEITRFDGQIQIWFTHIAPPLHAAAAPLFWHLCPGALTNTRPTGCLIITSRCKITV